MSNPPVDNQTKPSPDMIVVFLSVLAVLCAAFGTLLALAMVVADLETHSLTFSRMLLAVASLLGGLAAGGLLWAASWMVRRVQHFTSATRAPDASRPTVATPPPIPLHAMGPGDEVLKHILHELREIGRNVMLSPRARKARHVQQSDRHAEELVSAAEKAIEAHEFEAAQMHVDQLARELPSDLRLADLQARLTQTRQEAVVQDLRQVSQRTLDLMAVSSFAEAQKLADGLLARYPDSPEVAMLAEHVRREAASFISEQRRRMYREIEVHAENRRWRQAVTSANKFLQAYPSGAEADLVRVQMPTMQTNATIEEVRDLRDRILDYMDRRRYLEAIELSRDVINRFPQTAAAEELRQQLPRLLELAKTNPSVRQ